MSVIRKFVGYTGAAAGIGAAIAIAMSSQTGLAAAPANRVQEEPTAPQLTLSAACTAAIDAIKADFRADASEDNAERQAVRTDPTAAEAPGEDAGEVANLEALFSAARTACAPAATNPAFTKFTPSAQCTAAIAALKAAWMQGRPTTQSQWQNLQALAQAVRTACGAAWSRDR
jgi:hypothetical protein